MSATYEKLRSWTESPKHAEKYFSGTARYTKDFTLDATMLSADHRAYLDLGFVGDVATVRVNGREVGILWKPPFISDVTDFLRPGENLLEIDVTNQWVNRLIGDLKLPREERKTSTTVLGENPRPSSNPKDAGRFAQPEAGKYLRVSGLMGPVGLRFSTLQRYSAAE